MRDTLGLVQGNRKTMHTQDNHCRISTTHLHSTLQEEMMVKEDDAVAYLQSAISAGTVALVDRVAQFIGNAVRWL